MRPCALGLFLFGLIALVLIGCHNTDSAGNRSTGYRLTKDENRSAELQRNQFVDVPVPEEMELITRHNESYSFARGGVRLARLHYWSSAIGIQHTVDFYRENMPRRPFGWTPAGEHSEGEVHTLTFTKESERCKIVIKREDRGTAAFVKLNCE